MEPQREPPESPVVLVISPIPTHPTNAGNRARLLSLLEGLERHGLSVHLAYLDRVPARDIPAMKARWENFHHIPYGQEPSGLCRETGNWKLDDWFDDACVPALRKLADDLNPDLVIVQYIFMSKAFDVFGSGPLRILDTHDVFTDRNARMQEACPGAASWYSISAADEKQGLDRADYIVSIDAHSAKYFGTLSSRPQITLGHLPDVGVTSPSSESHAILFIGSANHINIHGIQWFVDNVLPRILVTLPTATLQVVGKVCSQLEVPESARKAVSKEGEVESLWRMYEGSAVVINPVQFGTGIAIKSLEAMAAGRPLVTSAAGARGLEFHAPGAFALAKDAEEMATAIVNLISNRPAAHSMSALAMESMKTYESQTAIAFEQLISLARGQRK